MDKLEEKLIAIRGGIGRGVKKAGRAIADTAKGTLANMKPEAVRKRKQEMKDFETARNEELMKENWGSVDNYLKTIPKEGTPEREEYDKLFTPTYVKFMRKFLK